MMERVIFLDCDGVLNYAAMFRNTRTAFPLSKEACTLFRGVCEAVGAKAVLSSAWRGLPQGERRLQRFGALKHWHPDKRTKHIGSDFNDKGALTRQRCRGDEIAEWLSRHPEVSEYAIVDDDSDMLPEQMPRFVQTDFEEGGLTQDHAERLIALFA